MCFFRCFNYKCADQPAQVYMFSYNPAKILFGLEFNGSCSPLSRDVEPLSYRTYITACSWASLPEAVLTNIFVSIVFFNTRRLALLESVHEGEKSPHKNVPDMRIKHRTCDMHTKWICFRPSYSTPG